MAGEKLFILECSTLERLWLKVALARQVKATKRQRDSETPGGEGYAIRQRELDLLDNLLRRV